MNVQRTAPASFTAEFENEQELRDEHRVNLSFGALRLLTAESIALHTALLVTLRGPWAGEIDVRATVVAALAGGNGPGPERKTHQSSAPVLPTHRAGIRPRT